MEAIFVQAPAAGESVRVNAAPAGGIRFDFDASQAFFSREGGNLLVVTEGGGSIRLDGYFETGDTLPDFLLADGSTVGGADFLASMSPDMDISTAAGPATPGMSSSGAGEYSDGAGVLLGGLDRLGSLGTETWERAGAAPEREVPVSPAAPVAPAGDEPGAAPEGAIPEDAGSVEEESGAGGGDAGAETPEFDGPFVRAVLYDDGDAASVVSTAVYHQDADGRPIALNAGDVGCDGQYPQARYQVETSVPEGWEQSWVRVSFNPATGRLEFRLTDEGRAELAALGMDGRNLVDFISVTVTDTLSDEAFTYNVQVVAASGPDYVSAEQDRDDQSHGTSYPGYNRELIGEYHQGKGQDEAYHIVGSGRQDEIVINETLSGGSEIHASGSSETASMADDYNVITLNSGILSSEAGKTTHVTSADGKLTVTGSVAASGGDTLIAMHNGDVSIRSDTDSGLSAAGGTNDVSGKNITISGGRYPNGHGVFASGDGENSVHSRDGSIVLNGISAVKAASGGHNTVRGEGDASITLNGNSYGLHADGANSKNVVSAENGSITIQHGSSAGMRAENGGINEMYGPDITVRNWNYGVESQAGGKNIIDAGAEGTVTVVSDRHTAAYAQGEGAVIDISGKDVSLSGYHAAVRVDGKGAADVKGETVNLSTTSGRTVDNWLNGTITIEAENELNIRLTDADQTSAGVMTLGGTTSLKSGGDVNIIVDKGVYDTSAINTWSNGTMNMDVEDNLYIKVHGEQGSKSGYITSGITLASGTNNIVAHNGDITLDIDASFAAVTGIYSGTGTVIGHNNISADAGKLTVHVTGTDGAYNALGITASGRGGNNISAGSMEVNVALGSGSNYQNNLSAAGILAAYNGQGCGVNNIDVAGKLLVSAGSAGHTGGIAAMSGGANTQNNITAGSLEVNVVTTGALAGSRATGIESSAREGMGNSTGGTNNINIVGDALINVTGKDLSAGFYSSSTGVQQFIAGGETEVNVTSTGGSAYGMFGKSELTSGSVRMTIKGDLSAVIMDGRGTVTSDDVRLHAESENGVSYGMYTKNTYGSNTIQSKPGHALDLEITADYAMYVEGGSGRNIIKGNSQSGGEGDAVRLNGDIQGVNGQNSITTGAGNDVIVINGAVSGSGALHVDGGAGTDTLVLVAGSVDEFVERYASWLNSLTAAQLKNIEVIEFSGVDDLEALRAGGLLDNFFSFAESGGILISVQEVAGSFSEAELFTLDAGGFIAEPGASSEEPVFGNSGGADSAAAGPSAGAGLFQAGGGMTQDAGLEHHAGVADPLFHGLDSLSGGGLSLNALAEPAFSGADVLDFGNGGGTADMDGMLAVFNGASAPAGPACAAPATPDIGLFTKGEGGAAQSGDAGYGAHAGSDSETLMVQQEILAAVFG